MINYTILKQASSENLDSVVKVAGVVRRLYNWFKQLSNDEYREQVLNLKSESVAVKSYMSDLSEQLDRLNNAIKDADVSDYESALVEVKDLSQLLYKELEGLHLAAEKSAVPAGSTSETDLPNEKVDQSPLSTMSIFISDKARQMFLVTVGKEVSDQIEKSPHFFNLFSKAIKGGKITKISPVKKDTREGQNYITVQFGPFSVPGINYVFTGTVLLNELPGQKLSLMRTLSVHYDDLPKTASRKDWFKKLAFVDGKVERFNNQLSQVKLAEVLRKGYQNAFGQDPSLQILGVAWAQAMVESSGNLMNNNMGNITAGKAWIESGKPYLVLKTQNDKPNGYKEFGPSGEVMKNLDFVNYRSYKTPEDGATYYWKLLKDYGTVLPWFGTGDALHSGLAMGDKTYYTANRFLYSGKMSSIYNKFIRDIAPQLSGMVSDPKPPPSQLPEYKAWKNSEPVKIPDKLVSNIAQNTMYTVNQDNDKPELVALNSGEKLSTPQNVQQVAQPNKEINDNEINSFINYLYASGPLDEIVKKAIENKLLNKTNFTINIKNNDNISIKFAKTASEFIKECFNCNEPEIFADDNNIEISSTITGDEETVLNAVNSSLKSFSEAFSEKYNHNVKLAISLNKSNLTKLSSKIINKSERLFHLKAI